MQVETLDGGAEKVSKAWNPNVEVEFRMWVGWKTDIQVVLGLDESDEEVDALEVLPEKVRLTGSTKKLAAKNAT